MCRQNGNEVENTFIQFCMYLTITIVSTVVQGIDNNQRETLFNGNLVTGKP